MNAREKAVKNLPLGEVAKQATELVCCRIKDELPGEPMVAAFHTNEIIDQVIRSFLPMETIRKMDLIVDTRYDGSTWKGVVQAVTVTVGFRKSHPFYSEQKGRLPYGAVTLVIKRKRTPKGLVFQRFECDHKEQESETLLQCIQRSAAIQVRMQHSMWEAARNVLEFRERHGQTELKRLIAALEVLFRLPNQYKYSKGKGPEKLDWSSEEDLLRVSGMSPRARAILDAADQGRRALPGGVDPQYIGSRDLPPAMPDMVDTAVFHPDGGWVVSGQAGAQRFYRYSIKEAINKYIEICVEQEGNE